MSGDPSPVLLWALQVAGEVSFQKPGLEKKANLETTTDIQGWFGAVRIMKEEDWVEHKKIVWIRAEREKQTNDAVVRKTNPHNHGTAGTRHATLRELLWLCAIRG